MNWITDLDGAFNRAGDLPPVQSLPHLSERQATFAAGIHGPNGERPKVEPTFLRRILNTFKTTPEDPVEALRKLLKGTGTE